MSNQRLVWVPEDEPGIEDVRVTRNAGDITFDSIVIRLLEGLPVRVTYQLVCDSAWRVRRLGMVADSEATSARMIQLEADGVGGWRDDKGNALAELQGCIDVDIMLTPLTNTLPINRLSLAPGESREINVVYLSAPDFSVRPFSQRYTRLDDADGVRRYRYESLVSGFTADLPADADGFVIDYPGIWRRVWPAR